VKKGFFYFTERKHFFADTKAKRMCDEKTKDEEGRGRKGNLEMEIVL
jgi:hypothetical protein